MATFSSHRLIMGKEAIDNFYWGYLQKKISEMFIELSSTFHMTFVQIGEFDWLLWGGGGGGDFRKNVNLLLRHHILDEAETWHTC